MSQVSLLVVSCLFYHSTYIHTYHNRKYDTALTRAYFTTSVFEKSRLCLAEKGVINALLCLLGVEQNERAVKITCLGALQNMTLVSNTGKSMPVPVRYSKYTDACF